MVNQHSFLQKLSLLLLLFNLVACQATYAHPHRPPPAEWHESIRLRVDEAYTMINRGVANGSLTHPEAVRLRNELAGIQARISRMSRDSRLSPREREIINDDLDYLYRHIYVEKHDRQYR